MKPWVVDAKDIEPEDLDQFSGQLLHLNNQIADFPRSATTELVIAQGLGKTLLLKAKRQSMGALSHDPARAGPGRQAERQSGSDEHREYGAVRETEVGWKALWSIAPSPAVEKHLGLCPELAALLDKMVRNEHLRSACDLFTNLLAFVARRLFRGIQGLCCAPAAGVPTRPTARSRCSSTTSTNTSRDFLASDLIDTEEQRAIYRSYWHFAQVGIASRRVTCIRSIITSRFSSRSAGSIPAHASAIRWACSSPARRWTCSTRGKI